MCTVLTRPGRCSASRCGTLPRFASLCGVSATVTKLGSAADLAARVLRHYAGAVLPLPASVRIVAATRGLTAVASVRQEPC